MKSTRQNRILCFDSGIGGLAYLQQLRQRETATARQWLYLADNAHFPFGEKDQDELLERICQVIGAALQKFPAQIVVLLCNTATVLALAELRHRLPQQLFIGTVPAIKPAAAASRRRSIAMLASRSTSQAAYVEELHRQFAANCQLKAINAAALIQFIEEQTHRWQEQESAEAKAAVQQAIAPFIGPVLESGADQVVLGCTHFLHLRSELAAALQAADPQLSLCDSVQGIAERLKVLQQQALTIAEGIAQPDRLLLTSSQDLPRWQFWAQRFALQLDDAWLQTGTLELAPKSTPNSEPTK